MRRHILQIVTVAGSMLLMLAALWPPVSQNLALAQPSRPTLTSAPRPSLTPTRHPGNDTGGKHEHLTPVPSGRITGTVIDLSSGASAPGIAVQVGDALVTTDANGNYDRGSLPAGGYLVALVLNKGQGTAAQEPQQIQLAEGETAIVHLNFSSRLLPTSPPSLLAASPTQSPMPNIPRALPATGERLKEEGLERYLGFGLIMFIVGLIIRHMLKHAG